jgi:CRP/FNR family transcriptional regulator, cyclic AMP receptor protein
MVKRSIAGLVLAIVLAVVGFSGISSAEDEVSALSKALRQAKLLSGLTEADRTALESAATLRHGRERERIIEQGKSSGRMFIILQSRADVRINGKPVVTLPVQALVGEIEFLDGPPATADVVLLGDTDLIVLNNAALTEIMERQPRLGYVIMSEIARIEARRLRLRK